MSKKNNIPQGKYTGHFVHFENQRKNVFTFIIDEAENDEMIGKGVTQIIGVDWSNNEQKK